MLKTLTLTGTKMGGITKIPNIARDTKIATGIHMGKQKTPLLRGSCLITGLPRSFFQIPIFIPILS
jgi:hypothetical protein